jgi:Cu/Ag efflux protein CusF
MKRTAILTFAMTLTASSLVLAQSGDMKDMDMHKDGGSHKCMDMKDMKGMDMKGMDMQKCQGMMDGQDKKTSDRHSQITTHHATGVVKAVDAANGKVTLAHGPVKTLKWPAMTMAFSVKDKALLDKAAVGKKVQVEFIQQGGNYVITSIK